MTVFSHSVAGGGGFLTGKQVVPLNYEAEASQRLLDALSTGDLKSAWERIDDPHLDVNFVGAASLKLRKSEIIARDELPIEVRVSYEEFKADVTPLFLAVQLGSVAFVQRLLSMGADVNQQLFRGFATTAATREGQLETLEILVKSGASQPACEEALLEASCHGWVRHVEVLMNTDQIRPHVAVHAFVTASSRGFNDVVNTLMKRGVDANATARVLLQSSKPYLHSNIECTALTAAIVCRQPVIVRTLLQAGVRTDTKVRLGAWSWDTSSGEEIRVGAGLGEPYALTWCAVEYFEATGTILRMLLKELSVDTPHHGRTLLHHAILCSNLGAVDVLLTSGSNQESPVITATPAATFRPIHLAARLGHQLILRRLIDAGSDINARTGTGETALMICARHKRVECLRILGMDGADFGLVSNDGSSSVVSIAKSSMLSVGFQQVVLGLVKDGKLPVTTNHSVFSSLLFAAEVGDVEALKHLIAWPRSEIDLDFQDERGFTAAMMAAVGGHVEAFRLLVYAGADVKLSSTKGETVTTLAEISQKRDQFEKVMLEHALEKDYRSGGAFCALHCAARRGDLEAAKKLLTCKGYHVDIPDLEGYTPLMVAAKAGHARVCELLIKHGASVDAKSTSGESVLSLARSGGGRTTFGMKESDVERLILDELAKRVVLAGARVLKHTKGGKGCPHEKMIKVDAVAGLLRWGKSSKRNVICRDAKIGPSAKFRKNRMGKKGKDGVGGEYEEGLFHVVTERNKEVHFVVAGQGSKDESKMWVRGILLVTRDVSHGGQAKSVLQT